MSKLTNHQIRAQINGLEVAIARLRGSKLTRALGRLQDYKAELAAREAAGSNPGTEIQARRFGEPKGGAR